MDATDWYYAIDAQNVAGCWENLESIRHCMQGGWQGGYEFYRWYISLKTCPKCKYKLIRLTLDKGDDKGPCTVCTKELFE